MAIYNKTELTAANAAIYDSLVPNNNTKQVSPTDIRDAAAQTEANTLDSLDYYDAGLNNYQNPVPTLGVTTTAAPFAGFTDTAPGSNPPPFITANLANNSLDITEPCRMAATIRILGRWNLNNNLTAYIYVNGAANAVTPIEASLEGNGNTDDTIFSASVINYVVTPADIATGGGTAVVELWLEGDGTYNVLDAQCALNLRYIPLTIRTT